MKKIFLIVIAVVAFFNIGHAQNDTMYLMKNDVVIGKYKLSNVDSIIFYQPTIIPINAFMDSRDGNVYHTTTIGNQIWMAENLKYLPSVSDSLTSSSTIAYYYIYGYNGTLVAEAKANANYATYGVLYNWTAATAGSTTSNTNPSGVQGVCPTDWHLPSDSEWIQLIDYLGGISIAGSKLKETGLSHWQSPNAGATNETGFTALPGGYRAFLGGFYDAGQSGLFWSTLESSPTAAWYQHMYYYKKEINSGSIIKEIGHSVRCVKD